MRGNRAPGEPGDEPGSDLTAAPWQEEQVQGPEPDPAGPEPYLDPLGRGFRWQDYPGGAKALYGYREF